MLHQKTVHHLITVQYHFLLTSARKNKIKDQSLIITLIVLGNKD